MFTSWNEFLSWEKTTYETIAIKKHYVDIAEDLMAGILLSQIVYWYLPNKEGRTKLRVQKEGHYWIAKKREEWYEEIRFSEANYKTAIKKLESKNLVIKKLFKFDGSATTHLRLNIPVFLDLLQKNLNFSANNIENGDEFESYFHEMSAKPLKHMGSVESTDPVRLNQPIQFGGINQSSSVESTNPVRLNQPIQSGGIDQPHSAKSTEPLTETTTKITTIPTTINFEEEELIKELKTRNLAYQILDDVLTEKGISQNNIYKTILECHKRGLTIFTMEDLSYQLSRMARMKEVGGRIGDFATYFANGLRDLTDQTKLNHSFYQDQHRSKQINPQPPLQTYNWLEEN